MKNAKKPISMVMIITLAAYLFLGSISAKGAIKLNSVVKGLKPIYKFKSSIKFDIASPNYTRKVKYKISLYNLSTKKNLDLTKGYCKSISGIKHLTLNVLPKTGGRYKLRIYVKALASKLSYDKYLEKSFTVEADKKAITSAIGNALKLVESKTVGTKIGNVPENAKDTLQGIINSAKAVKGNMYAEQVEVDKETRLLNKAISDFNSAVISSADKSALINLIKTAQQRVNNTVVGIQPLKPGQVLSSDKLALVKAITIASSVAAHQNVTTKQADDALIELNNAIEVFTCKVQGSGVTD